MTELQMGLIGLGAIAVVGVVAYNKWQEVRQRRQAEQALKASHPDVLLDAAVEHPEKSAGQLAPAIEREEPQAVPAASLAEQAASHQVYGAANERIEPVLRLDPEPEELPPLAGGEH